MHSVLNVVRAHRLISLVVAATLVAGSYAGYTQVFAFKAPDQPLQTAKVERGNLRLAVSASGSVISPRAVDLAFKQSGTVEEVYVQAGDMVAAGQPMAKLEARTLEFQVRQSEIAFRSAQLTLDALIAGARPEEITAANAFVESARAKLHNMESQGDAGDVIAAEANLESARAKLRMLTNPTEADLASARASVDTATASLQSAIAKFEQLRNPTPSDVRSAESALAAAQAKLLALRNPTAVDLANAHAGISSAEANLGTARTKLDQLKNPTPDKIADAQSALKGAEIALVRAEHDLDQIKVVLNDEKVRNLIKAYTDLWLARQKLAEDQAINAPSDRIAADEAAMIHALRAVQAAEEDTNTYKAGYTPMQIQAAVSAVDKAKADISGAQIKLNKLMQPTVSDLAAAQNEVASSEAGLKSAKAKLEQLMSPSPADIIAAESSVSKVQADLDKLRNPQPADLAAAEASVASAQANLTTAQARHAQLLNPSASDLAAANSAIAQAENQLRQTRVPYKDVDLTAQRASLQQAMASLSKTSAPSTVQDIAKAQLNVDKAELDLDQAQYSLDQAVLKAPFDGIIAKVSIVPGGLQSGAGGASSGGAGAGAISVIDPNGMQAQVSVDETDVSRLQLGQTAMVSVESAGPVAYRGRIIAISPSGTVQSGVTTYQVLLALESAASARPEPVEGRAVGARPGQGQGGPSGQQRQRPQRSDGQGADQAQLRAGMTAVATIVYAERQDVLLVPNRAVKRTGQQRTVDVQVGAKTESRTVTVGLTDDQRSEVREGLSEGEIVVLPASTAGQQSGQRPQAGGFGAPAAGFGGAGFRPIGR